MIMIYQEISHGINQICSGQNCLVIPGSPQFPDVIYTMEDLPDTYERYKKAALKYNKRVEERRCQKQGNWGDKPNPLPGNKGPTGGQRSMN